MLTCAHKSICDAGEPNRVLSRSYIPLHCEASEEFVEYAGNGDVMATICNVIAFLCNQGDDA